MYLWSSRWWNFICVFYQWWEVQNRSRNGNKEGEFHRIQLLLLVLTMVREFTHYVLNSGVNWFEMVVKFYCLYTTKSNECWIIEKKFPCVIYGHNKIWDTILFRVLSVQGRDHVDYQIPSSMCYFIVNLFIYEVILKTMTIYNIFLFHPWSLITSFPVTKSHRFFPPLRVVSGHAPVLPLYAGRPLFDKVPFLRGTRPFLKPYEVLID